MTDCIHHTRAQSDIRLLQAQLGHASWRVAIGIKRQIQEFEKTMNAHRECRCQELRESA